MRNRTADTKAAVLFLLPFLAVYSLFLVYPLLKGFWISLHEWDLVTAALNPESIEYVGLKNYVRIFWGTEMGWHAMVHPGLQIAVLVGLAAVVLAFLLKKLNTGMFLGLSLLFALGYLAFGWAPGEEGRWYTRRFWPSVGNTILFVAWTVPAITALSLILAVLLNQKTRLAAVLRSLFFLTTVLSVTVATLIWKLLLSPHGGPLTEAMSALGIAPVAWLSSEGWAMASVVIVTVWWGIGISMMLFLAGLQEISEEIYDAARIDGIGPIRTFWSITIPNMTRTITLVVVLGLIAHFQVFGQVHLMTQGGPGDSTQVLVRLIYETGFRDNNLGRATAMSMFLLVIMMVFSTAQILIGRRASR